MTDAVARLARAAGARCYTDPFVPNHPPAEQAKHAVNKHAVNKDAVNRDPVKKRIAQ